MDNDSLAMELVKDYKKQNKRLFIIWIITFIAFLSLLGYTIYLLNDVGIIDTTTQTIDNVQSIENSNIINGE